MSISLPTSSYLDVPLPKSFEKKVADKKQVSDFEFSPLWKILAKTIEYISAGIIIVLGLVLLGVSSAAIFSPIVFSAALLMGSLLVVAGGWFILKDCYKEAYPIEYALTKIAQLRERVVSDGAGTLFDISQIPQSEQLASIFEFIALHKYAWNTATLVSDPKFDFEIFGIEKKGYIKLPLMLDLQGRRRVTVGIESESGDLVAISELRSWNWEGENLDDQYVLDQFQIAQIFPEIFSKLKKCAAEEESGVITPNYHCLDISSEKGRQQFIVQKLCIGKKMAQVLQANSVTETQKSLYAKDLFEGILKMHEQGLLCRNFSLEHILIDTRAYFTNFSYMVNAELSKLDMDPYYNLKSQQEDWQLKYLPPETLLDDEYDERSEVYSFGILLYALFKEGLPPTAAEIERRLARGEAACESMNDFEALYPSQELPSDPLDALLFQMMSANYDERPSMREAYAIFVEVMAY